MDNKKSNRIIYCSEEEKQWLKTVLEKKRAGDTLGIPVSVVIGDANVSTSVSNDVSNSSITRDTNLCTLLVWALYSLEYRERQGKRDMIDYYAWGDFQLEVKNNNVGWDTAIGYLSKAYNEVASQVGDFEFEYPKRVEEPEEKPKPKKDKSFNPFSSKKKSRKD